MKEPFTEIEAIERLSHNQPHIIHNYLEAEPPEAL